MATTTAGQVTTAPVEREFTVKSRSQTQQALRRFVRNKLAVGALVLYVVILLVSFLGPLFYGWSYSDQDSLALSTGPGTGGHPFGTDEIGQDLLARMMRGVQRSTYISVLFVLVAGTLGVLIGAIAGYFGKWIDNVLMRLVDIILTIPILVAIIVIAANFPGVALLLIVLSINLIGDGIRDAFDPSANRVR